MKVTDSYFFHKNPPDNYSRKWLSAFILSILLHGICFLIANTLEFRFIGHEKNIYSTITIVENNLNLSITKNETILKSGGEIGIARNKEESDKNGPRMLKTVEIIISDTSEHKREVFIPQNELTNDYENLKFAKSLLDTFLIWHPEYSSYILSEQAKNMDGNPYDKESFSLAAMEKKINDELHKYISEKFPEGSEHEINKYTGPGINIPIGDLIDLIKKIF